MTPITETLHPDLIDEWEERATIDPHTVVMGGVTIKCLINSYRALEKECELLRSSKEWGSHVIDGYRQQSDSRIEAILWDMWRCWRRGFIYRFHRLTLTRCIKGTAEIGMKRLGVLTYQAAPRRKPNPRHPAGCEASLLSFDTQCEPAQMLAMSEQFIIISITLSLV